MAEKRDESIWACYIFVATSRCLINSSPDMVSSLSSDWIKNPYRAAMIRDENTVRSVWGGLILEKPSLIISFHSWYFFLNRCVNNSFPFNACWIRYRWSRPRVSAAKIRSNKIFSISSQLAFPLLSSIMENRFSEIWLIWVWAMSKISSSLDA